MIRICHGGGAQARFFLLSGMVYYSNGSAVTTPDTDFFLQHTEPGAGAVSAVDYSRDYKTDELIKISTIFRFSLGHGRTLKDNKSSTSYQRSLAMDAVLPKIKK